jgi:diacylglycerol kinase (ATP)
MKGQPFRRRLGFAVRGLRLALAREASFRTQLFAAAAVLALLLVTRPAPLWWAVMALAVGFVLVAELLNTALEAVVDRLHPERHPEIGAAKDIAAGAVLVASAIAVAVGIAYLLHWLAG